MDIVKKQLLEANMLISFDTKHRVQSLRVVHSYKYLGEKITANCGLIAEMNQRNKSCMAALGPVAGRCFNNDNIDMEKKVNISRSLLFSRMTFAAGNWQVLNTAEAKKFS